MVLEAGMFKIREMNLERASWCIHLQWKENWKWALMSEWEIPHGLMYLNILCLVWDALGVGILEPLGYRVLWESISRRKAGGRQRRYSFTQFPVLSLSFLCVAKTWPFCLLVMIAISFQPLWTLDLEPCISPTLP